MTTPAGKTITYSFDAVGNRKSMLDPDGGRFTYSYDAANQIDHLVNPQNERTSYSYDAAGRRTLKKLANETRASFTYDAADRLTSLYNLKSDSSVISSFEYAYDNAANRTHVVEANGDRVTWSYDNTYQLTAERRSGANAYAQTFVYDSVGNRLVKNADGSRTTTVYDAANQIEYSVDASGRTTYTFDATGNQQLVVEPSGDRTTNAWDYENLNTEVELASGTVVTYAWNADSQRVAKNVDGSETKMVCDKENILLESDGADATQVVYTLEPQVYGNVISERRKSGAMWLPKYYEFDAQGSTRSLTDTSQLVTDAWLYDAWGNIVSHVGRSSPPFLWVGEVEYYYDRETGQYAIRLRIGGPTISRWMSCDPAGLVAGPNQYSYARNEPTTHFDPTGLVSTFHDWTMELAPDFRTVCNPDMHIAFTLCVAAAAVPQNPVPQQIWQLVVSEILTVDRACIDHTYTSVILDVWDATAKDRGKITKVGGKWCVGDVLFASGPVFGEPAACGVHQKVSRVLGFQPVRNGKNVPYDHGIGSHGPGPGQTQDQFMWETFNELRGSLGYFESNHQFQDCRCPCKQCAWHDPFPECLSSYCAESVGY